MITMSNGGASDVSARAAVGNLTGRYLKFGIRRYFMIRISSGREVDGAVTVRVRADLL